MADERSRSSGPSPASVPASDDVAAVAPGPDDAAPLWIKVRASSAERVRWQELAASRGVSLSELIRSRLDRMRLRARRDPLPVAPDLLRELARIGNNLNQLARAANRREPVMATALLARLIKIDRELAALRGAYQRQDAAPDGGNSANAAERGG